MIQNCPSGFTLLNIECDIFRSLDFSQVVKKIAMIELQKLLI